MNIFLICILFYIIFIHRYTEMHVCIYRDRYRDTKIIQGKRDTECRDTKISRAYRDIEIL